MITNPLEGKTQMAITVKEVVYLFDFADDRKSMVHEINTEWKVVVLLKLASYNVQLKNKEAIVKEANIEFPVLSEEAWKILNGTAKVSRGHLDSIPHLGAVVDHFQEIYEHEKNKMPVL